MENKLILETAQNNHCYEITLNKPEKHNAFDPQLIKKLTQVFKEASSSNCRSVLLSGNGKSFSAGADLEWMKSMASASEQDNKVDSEKLFEMFEAGAICTKPVIGKVQGNVMGGGLGLVAICDIAAAEKHTKFSFSEVKLGLAPATISPFVLKKCSAAVTKELMLTGRLFSAEEAKEIGLVQFIGTQTEVDEYTHKQCQRFLKIGPEAVAATKTIINDDSLFAWKQLKAQTSKVIAERRVSDEGQEGLKSFFEKRKPSWSIEE